MLKAFSLQLGLDHPNDVGPRGFVREFGVGYLATLPHLIVLSVFSPHVFLHFLVSSCSEAGTGIGGEVDLGTRFLPIPIVRATRSLLVNPRCLVLG